MPPSVASCVWLHASASIPLEAQARATGRGSETARLFCCCFLSAEKRARVAKARGSEAEKPSRRHVHAVCNSHADPFRVGHRRCDGCILLRRNRHGGRA
eukprot:4975868-Pleurochrysis_carterae.AAC.6